MNIHLRSDSSGAIGVASRRGLQRLRHLDVRFLWLASCQVPENVADAHTKPADKRSLEFCRLNMGVTEIPRNSFVIQSCDKFATVFLSLCHRSCSHVPRQPSSFATKRDEFRFRQRECHSALVWEPAAERGANILRCLWCFTLLMNLHDFVCTSSATRTLFPSVGPLTTSRRVSQLGRGRIANTRGVPRASHSWNTMRKLVRSRHTHGVT